MSGELPSPSQGAVTPGSGRGVEEVSSSTTQETIAEVLQRDLLSAEFLLALFWSAMSSFRHDSILRPFPPMFLEGRVEAEPEGVGENSSRREEEQKDIEGLREVFTSFPPLERIATGKATLSTQQAELLHWILNPKRFTVSSKEPASFTSILEHSPSTADTALRKPKHIFELKYNEDAESKFCSVTGEHGLMYAFHGSSVENFYSIVHNGLLNIFNKVSAFGEGTYLSTELGVCLNWSPSGSFRHAGGNGTLPEMASCIAMCEVVKHPSVMSRYQVGGEPNIQGKVPEKYFIVSNDEYIRIKYVMVYETQKPVVRSRGWLYQHKHMVVLFLYLFFLLAIGASQSRIIKKFFRKFYNHYFY